MKRGFGQLIQQGLDMRGVIDVLVGQIKCDDRAAVGVNAKVQLAPGAAFRSSMFFKQPFARSAQLQPRAVGDQVKAARFRSPVGLNRQSARPPAQRRMIGDGQIDFQHSHDRANQPFALAERQSKHRSQCQRCFNGEIGIMRLAAPRRPGCAFQPASASSVNQIVRLPRLRSAAS